MQDPQLNRTLEQRGDRSRERGRRPPGRWREENAPCPVTYPFRIRRAGSRALAGGDLRLDGVDLRLLDRRHLGDGVRVGDEAELDLDLVLDVRRDVRVLEEEVAGVLLALPQLVAVVGVPGAGLAHDAVLDTEVDEAALAGYADAVQDVELRLLEGRGHLVLDDLHPRAVTHRVGAVLEGLDAPDVQAHGGVRSEEHTSELQSRQYLVCRLLLEKKK